MLKQEDRIFKNLYNDPGSSLNDSSKEMIGRIRKN